MDSKSDASKTEKIHKDAKGQFVRSDEGSTNNGVASAKPRVITGSDDATSQKKSGKDWKLHHDEAERNEGEFRG